MVPQTSFRFPHSTAKRVYSSSQRVGFYNQIACRAVGSKLDVLPPPIFDFPAPVLNIFLPFVPLADDILSLSISLYNLDPKSPYFDSPIFDGILIWLEGVQLKIVEFRRFLVKQNPHFVKLAFKISCDYSLSIFPGKLVSILRYLNLIFMAPLVKSLYLFSQSLSVLSDDLPEFTLKSSNSVLF